MRRQESVVFAFCLTAFFVAGSVLAFPTVFSTRLTIAVPELVQPGFVIATGPDGVTVAINLEGRVVHTWHSPLPGSEIDYARPLDNGNVLALLEPEANNLEYTTGAIGTRSVVVELDQDSNIVWQYQDVDRLLHHDHSRLSNGNYLLLCSREIDRPDVSPEPLVDDCLIEVDQNGEVVWEWQTANHFDEFEFSDGMKARIAEHSGDWAHANSAAAIPNNVPHQDPRFAPGNIVVSYRFINTIVIIDRQTGDIVWKTADISIGQHDVEMLPSGLSGAGNILVFDNGVGSHYYNGGPGAVRSFSRIIEIDPTDLSIPYEYTARDSGLPVWWFSSHFIGGVQRLPNGNTLITEGVNGRVFEVTPEGQIVWEFINPVTGRGRFGLSNAIYRADKVPLDWRGLAGIVD